MNELTLAAKQENMQTRSSYGLIHVGLNIRLLMNLAESDIVDVALVSFNNLEEELEVSELFVSLNAIRNLNQLQNSISKLKEKKATDLIGKDLSQMINQEMISIENIVFSESSIKKIYIIPQRRYNEKYLIEEPSKLLKQGVFDKFSEIGKTDFVSACRCLSFGESTASAFHILRVTEDTLKKMYCHYKKTKRLKKPMWGPMTQELRNKKEPKPDSAVLDTLDVIRNSYRNPTQHPQVVYDIDGAQDLFGLCLDILNKMTQSL